MSSNAILNLQEQLNNSWDEDITYLNYNNLSFNNNNNKDQNNRNNNENESYDMSSLVLNLTTQTEYNNKLLDYIKELEIKYQQSENIKYELIHKIKVLEKDLLDSNNRADDLYNKLTISSSLCDELATQFQTLRNDVIQSDNLNKDNKMELQSYLQKNVYLEEQNREYSLRIIQLESTVDELNRYRTNLHLNESQETELVHLKYQLNTIQSELEKQNKLYYELSLNSNNLQAENIQLNQTIQYYMKQHEEDMMQKDKLMLKYKELTNQISNLQTENLNLSTENEQLEQKNSILTIQIHQSITNHNEAVQHSHETDLKWRELEELVKKYHKENQILEEEKETYLEKIQSLEERIDSFQERDREWEK